MTEKCGICGGSGMVQVTGQNGKSRYKVCPSCGGSGR